MRDNGRMADPVLVPRNPFVGLVLTWAAAAVGAVLIGLFAPRALLMAWYLVGFGICILLSFAVQLFRGETRGYILRVSAGSLGALLVMGIVSAGFGIAALFGV